MPRLDLIPVRPSVGSRQAATQIRLKSPFAQRVSRGERTLTGAEGDMLSRYTGI